MAQSEARADRAVRRGRGAGGDRLRRASLSALLPRTGREGRRRDRQFPGRHRAFADHPELRLLRSEEHTSELQSLMRISYAVFCLKKKKNTNIKCIIVIIIYIKNTLVLRI